MEVWKNVLGYENKYQVSNLGRIKSLLKKDKDFILKEQTFNKTGYKNVDLCFNGSVKKKTVHRIVAISFIPNPENKPQVNHINGIKADNRVENLEWNTRSENQLHSIKLGLRSTVGEKNSQSKLNEIKVLNIFKDKSIYKEISTKYNISISTISDIKRGYSWTHITGLKNIKKNI